jgi:hypothetical protein
LVVVDALLGAAVVLAELDALDEVVAARVVHAASVGGGALALDRAADAVLTLEGIGALPGWPESQAMGPEELLTTVTELVDGPTDEVDGPTEELTMVVFPPPPPPSPPSSKSTVPPQATRPSEQEAVSAGATKRARSMARS